MNIYQQEILHRYKNLKHTTKIQNVNLSSTAANTSCGDLVNLEAKVLPTGKIIDISHKSEGCIICVVAADLLCQSLLGKEINNNMDEHTLINHLGIDLTTNRVRCVKVCIDAYQDLINNFNKTFGNQVK